MTFFPLRDTRTGWLLGLTAHARPLRLTLQARTLVLPSLMSAVKKLVELPGGNHRPENIAVGHSLPRSCREQASNHYPRRVESLSLVTVRSSPARLAQSAKAGAKTNPSKSRTFIRQHGFRSNLRPRYVPHAPTETPSHLLRDHQVIYPVARAIAAFPNFRMTLARLDLQSFSVRVMHPPPNNPNRRRTHARRQRPHVHLSRTSASQQKRKTKNNGGSLSPIVNYDNQPHSSDENIRLVNLWQGMSEP